jgi:hypothetical protein
MELHEALSRIDTIRRQLARTEKFRGYRAVPVAGGGILALVAAALQSTLAPDPSRDLQAYLSLWISVAVLAGGLTAWDVWQRHRTSGSHGNVLTRLACEQFAPCVVAGGLITGVIARCAPEAAWMLPGLWSVFFSLGLFASLRLLPNSIIAVAGWYLSAGCCCLALGPTTAGLAPWTMALIFGTGQLAAAAALASQQPE